jgi:anthranilate synthase component 1
VCSPSRTARRSGLVGYLGDDVVRRIERLPSTAPDELGMPELAMMLVTDLAVLDHSDGTVLLIANVLPGHSVEDDPYGDAVARLDAMATALAEPAPATVSALDLAAQPQVVRRTSPEAYEAAVEAGR